ncbi:MAG: hypothetical protein ABSB78_05890 [Bacteroidota bacterium]
MNIFTKLFGRKQGRAVFVLGVSSNEKALEALSSLSFSKRDGDDIRWPSDIKADVFIDKGGAGVLIILKGNFSKAQQDEVKKLGKYEEPRLKDFVAKVVAGGAMGAIKSGGGGVIHVLTKKYSETL